MRRVLERLMDAMARWCVVEVPAAAGPGQPASVFILNSFAAIEAGVIVVYPSPAPAGPAETASRSDPVGAVWLPLGG